MHYLHTPRTSLCSLINNRSTYSTFKTFFELQKRFVNSPSKLSDSDGSGRSSKASPVELAPICLPALQTPNVSPEKKKKSVSLWEGIPGSDKLITVTDHNIDQIFNKYSSILIMFYGSWCSVCKDVNIEIAKAATMIKDRDGALGVCDAMDNIKLVDKFLIRKTPSIKYFKNGQYVADYIGKPMAEDIILFMKNPPTQSFVLSDEKSTTDEKTINLQAIQNKEKQDPKNLKN